jgi:SAM-dependent methyltransferase
MTDSISTYDARAREFAAQYESLNAATVYSALVDYFKPRRSGAMALDVGAGSGRDAAWLCSLSYEVVAAEPAAGMRAEGRRRHSESPIRWLDDRLPDLHVVHGLGLGFDLILLSAVWMHVPEPVRPRAFRKLATLLKPGGILLLTLREGPSEPNREMWPARLSEIERFARTHGLAVLRSIAIPDQLGRPEVRWTAVCLQLPDDGTGSLPLLRGVILNDDKSSTYKLGLLRSIARIADTTPALATARLDEDAVDLPLGLVALNWVRMYLPLVLAGLPQRPGNVGPDGLDFAKASFRRLLGSKFAGQDLRVGAHFVGERAQAVAGALAEARKTIARMPANFTRFPNSDAKVFTAVLATPPRRWADITLDDEVLRTFGTLTVPGSIWRTLQRLSAWIEPVLVGEWVRLVHSYAERMSRSTSAGEIEAALAWLDPARDTNLARAVAKRLLEGGRLVSCVWTGARLSIGALDIDHCLPWSAWPCGDLWNLLPTSRHVNQHLKRDRLPSARALAGARESIISWWDTAWRNDPGLASRFDRESFAALPIIRGATSDEIFAGLEWRRLRLRQDQQVSEWAGLKIVSK